MRNLAGLICILGMLGLAAFGAESKGAPGRDSMVITFKDGHQQKIPMADIARIEFQGSPAKTADVGPLAAPGIKHFVGKWEVGDGAGSTFYITLDPDGQAEKSQGASHGTWALINGEAQISWDDGWHDIIRKVGAKHEKVAFEPGKTFSDSPSNVTNARNTQAEPL
ncbi:MAG TPA: hypothetical protein VMH85_07185 [Terriglobales bacterium]|nr:hypothetical protein [Terriglobales bacterium]